MSHPTRHWQFDAQADRVTCTLCPRECRLGPEQRGMCYVRKREGNAVVLDTYGRSSGFCIDPIEKKPLNHFLPGTAILSFGTAGCNLACKFCQNHDISKSRQQDSLSAVATPQMIAKAAVEGGARSVAYTYNDPVIFMEYAVDIAAECRARDVKNVAVTAGYISDAARPEFFGAMDAANIDLKAFSPKFYKQLTASDIGPVLDSIVFAVKETECWVEITTLLIPGENDSDAEIEALSSWVLENCGPDVPLHFTAFHPDHRMLSHPRTPHATLTRARGIAQRLSLRHVYVGNVHDKAAQSSYCAGCGALVIARDWHRLSTWNLDDFGACVTCGTQLPGRFEGPPGKQGRKRQRVRIAQASPGRAPTAV